ncbi:MAG TPA: phosphopyruvate hydratase [Thermodesulfobacteriota bacterium]|nr:phosphopyruvate hydratase [Thermodesulfobacteriota bacterium]
MIFAGKGKKDPRISTLKAREILDSKARPMVEVDVWTVEGSMGRGASPCGTSVGSHEAFILRDGGSRFGGLGVLKAVENVNEIISPALKGRSVLDQRAIDHLLIELDGTPNKSRLGANAIYSVSMAAARAAANSLGIPLYRYLGGAGANRLPVPMFNMINGGSHPDATMEFQEFLLIPAKVGTYGEALRMGVEIFSQLGEMIGRKKGLKSLSIGSSAGYAAPTGEPPEALEMLLLAAKEAGYEGRVKLGLDCAASHFFQRGEDYYRFQGKKFWREEIIRYLEDLARAYPLFMIEDPLEEDDFEGFAEMTRRFKCLIVGDDLFVTNPDRLKKGIALGSANGMILKPNMVGTLSEAMDAADLARKHGYWVVGSGRAGGSLDDPIPEISVAVGAPLVKFGAPRTGERLAKQNVLLRIEEELGESGRFAGVDIFAG